MTVFPDVRTEGMAYGEMMTTVVVHQESNTNTGIAVDQVVALTPESAVKVNERKVSSGWKARVVRGGGEPTQLRMNDGDSSSSASESFLSEPDVSEHAKVYVNRLAEDIHRTQKIRR